MTKKGKKSVKSPPRLVECDDHGSTPDCLVCKHLCDRRGLGYWAIKSDDTGPDQAWCNDCDAVLEEDRGWSDRACAVADWQIYCTFCYDKTLKRHKLLGWLPGVRPEDVKRPRRKKK